MTSAGEVAMLPVPGRSAGVAGKWSLARSLAARAFACLLMGLFGFSPVAAQAPSPPLPQPLYKFTAQADLVLVNVVARDRSGALVRDLKASDFSVQEDGKVQHVSSFDIESTEAFAGGSDQQSSFTPVSASILTSDGTPAADALRGRRLVVLFFDFGSMQPEESQRAIDAAQQFVERQMTPADMAAIATYSTSLQVAQDFTTDRAVLAAALKRLSAVEGEGLANGTTGDSSGQPDIGEQYTPDDTEYNLFNTDMSLHALGSLAQALGRLQQRKSILYFSGGLTRTGIDNQTQLRAAINTAVRANVALYAVDIRGLQALPPGGQAQVGSLRGTSTYSGAAVQSDLDANFASQETLVTLASDTGGKAFLDSNDFSRAFTAVQRDNEFYYMLAYRSTNRALDGRYRHITVKVGRPGVNLEYRAGYYAPRDWTHSTHEDREQQLEDELASGLPNTDLPVYLGTSYFRMADQRFYVGTSVVVPGSSIPFTASGDKDKATLDVLGVVRDRQTKLPVGTVREAVKLAAETAQQVRRKNIQYETGFLLPAGGYHLKFVVRENQTGRLGSFETDLTVPDLKKAPLKMSSVVLSSRHEAKIRPPNPLPVVPNVAHVFTSDQPLLLYYEVYDPARKPAMRLLTNIQFFRGKVKAYETPMVEARELNTPQRRAAAFEIEVPAAQLRPGWYTCQVSVIDDAGGVFAFPRLPLFIRSAPAPGK
jgi:VWFA-related protein